MNLANMADVLRAIQKLDVKTFSRLAKDDAPLNWTIPDDGYNPFLFALKVFSEKISGIPLDEKSSGEQIAELEDIGKKAMSILSIFLENGANVNCEDKDGCTSLGLLKYYYYLEMLSFLPIAMDGKAEEKKEVMKTVTQMFDDITSVLVESGANENRKNKFGETPSEYADRIMMGGIEKRL